MARPAARRACDRCHAVKERCRRLSSHDACERCQRLKNACQTLRPVGTAGRKPRYQRTEDTTHDGQLNTARGDRSPSVASSSPSYPASAASPTMLDWDIVVVPRSPSPFADLTERERHFVKGVSQGLTRIDQFLVAPSFRICHHKAFAQQLYQATSWVQDSLIATAAVLACEYEPGASQEDQTIGHRRAASAVSTLRSVKAVDRGELATLLMLAVSATTFAMHISGNALEICRHGLAIIKPIYESTTELSSDCLAFVICLVHTEMEQCILRGEVPTLRFNVQGTEGVVDRYLGIASPTLPYLYDVCEITYSLSQNKTLNVSERQALDTIEVGVEAWTPTLPQDHATRFLEEEVASIVAQAKLQRWLLLLIIHRLRHPYGTESARGTVLSSAILKELRSMLQCTKRSVPGTTIPYMFACFELVDPAQREEALDKVDVVVAFSKESRAIVKKQLMAFWVIRDSADQMHWCDIISWLPQGHSS